MLKLLLYDRKILGMQQNQESNFKMEMIMRLACFNKIKKTSTNKTPAVETAEYIN